MRLLLLLPCLVECTPITPPPRMDPPSAAPSPRAPLESSSSCESSSGLPASDLRPPFEALARRVNELVPEGCIDKGCPPPAALPACDAALLACEQLSTPETFHERARKLQGKKIAVRGQLVRLRHLTTALECTGASCCNRSRAMLAIGNAADAVMLLDGDGPGVFSCMGDESANCCVLDPNVEVAAVGVVSAYKLGHGLSRVSLCTIDKKEKAGP